LAGISHRNQDGIEALGRDGLSVLAKSLNVEFNGLADIYDGLLSRSALTHTTRETGDFGHPHFAVARIDQRLPHTVSVTPTFTRRFDYGK